MARTLVPIDELHEIKSSLRIEAIAGTGNQINCEVIDLLTGQVYLTHRGADCQETVDEAVIRAKTARKPETIADKDARIARLEAELAARTERHPQSIRVPTPNEVQTEKPVFTASAGPQSVASLDELALNRLIRGSGSKFDLRANLEAKRQHAIDNGLATP